MSRKSLAALSLAALLLCGACDETAAVVAAAAPEPMPGAFEPHLEPGRVVRGYSWDGVATIPWLSEQPPEHLAFGELGRTPLTGLYLTFNHDLASELALQPEGWKLEPARLEPAQGRFGGGVRLAADSVLRCTLPEKLRDLGAWTVELWVRPEKLAVRDLFEVPGLLSLVVLADGRVEIRVPGAGDPDGKGAPKPLVYATTKTLVAGQWNHVGAVFDVQDTRGVRVVVNGEARGVRMDTRRIGAHPEKLLFGDVKGTKKGLECALDEVRFVARNLSTEELAQHWALARKPVERLHLEYASGEEELELWREPFSDPRVDTPDEWARGELTHAFASPAGLAWTRENWRAVACDDRPTPRTTHPIVSLGQRRVFTFGGEIRDTHWGRSADTNDTWIYDGASEHWTRVPAPDALLPRCHMPAAYSPDHDLVLLTGGWWQGGWWSDENEHNLSDTWVLHVSEGRWEQKHPAGDELPRHSDHGLMYLPSKRCFLGLINREAWTYDPDADRWERLGPFRVVDADGKPATGFAEYSYSCVLDPVTEKVLTFGGVRRDGEQEVYLDETGLYDLDTNTITVLDLPVRPAARVRPALAFDPVRDRFVLFGGVLDQFSQRFDDLWTFDPRARRWSEVAPTGFRPSARGGFFGMAYDEVADHFVLVQGRNSPDRWQDETYEFELDEHAEGRARYVFDRQAFPAARAWFVESDTPGGSAVHARFRGSADGLRFGEWSEECPVEGRFVQVELELTPGADGAQPLVRAMGFRDAS